MQKSCRNQKDPQQGLSWEASEKPCHNWILSKNIWSGSPQNYYNDDIAKNSNECDNWVNATIEDMVNNVVVGMRDHSHTWNTI